MALHGVHDLLVRCRFQCFLVRLGDRCNGGGTPAVISSEKGCVVRTFMMVGADPRCIKGVDCVGPDGMMFCDVSAAVGQSFFFGELTERGHSRVARISFLE